MSTPIEQAEAERDRLRSDLAATAARLGDAEQERDMLREALRDASIIATYEREDGRREWVGFCVWIYTGQCVVVMDHAAIDAARKEDQS